MKVFFSERFSLLFFLVIVTIFWLLHIKKLNLRKLNQSTLFGFYPEKKLMLASYLIYTGILIFIKYYCKEQIDAIEKYFNIDIKYIEYQLIICAVYFDKLKDMCFSNFIGGYKEDVEKFRKIVEKNKENLDYEKNVELIDDWEKCLKKDDWQLLEHVIIKLNIVNKEFLNNEKSKLDKKVDEILNGNNSKLTKKQKKELRRIRNGNEHEITVLGFSVCKRNKNEITVLGFSVYKRNKNEITVHGFLIYKTNIEEIIGETDE